jgi:hypothetical protein
MAFIWQLAPGARADEIVSGGREISVPLHPAAVVVETLMSSLPVGICCSFTSTQILPCNIADRRYNIVYVAISHRREDWQRYEAIV